MRRCTAVAAGAAFALFLIDAGLVMAGATAALDRAILDGLRAGAPGVTDFPDWLRRAATALTMLGTGWVRAIVAIGVALVLALRNSSPRFRGEGNQPQAGGGALATGDASGLAPPPPGCAGRSPSPRNLGEESRGALILILAWASGAILVEILKPLFGRARPDLVYRLVPVTEASFPSGHATGAMLLYPLAGALLAGRRGGADGFLLALAIGLTRILLGVHWTSDVIGGWLLGGTIALLALSAGRTRSAK